MKLYVGRAQKFQILEFDDRLEPSLRTIPFGDQKNWGYLPYGKCLYAPCTDRLAWYRSQGLTIIFLSSSTRYFEFSAVLL